MFFLLHTVAGVLAFVADPDPGGVGVEVVTARGRIFVPVRLGHVGVALGDGVGLQPHIVSRIVRRISMQNLPQKKRKKEGGKEEGFEKRIWQESPWTRPPCRRTLGQARNASRVPGGETA